MNIKWQKYETASVWECTIKNSRFSGVIYATLVKKRELTYDSRISEIIAGFPRKKYQYQAFIGEGYSLETKGFDNFKEAKSWVESAVKKEAQAILMALIPDIPWLLVNSLFLLSVGILLTSFYFLN